MTSRNVFRFVSLRAPQYTPPDPAPFGSHAILIAFLPDRPDPPDSTVPPDSGIPPNPLPVPLVTDPEAERRFFAAIGTASDDGATARRQALIARAEAIRASDDSFARSADWRALRQTETLLRRLLAAHGPALPLSDDAPWLRGVAALLAQVRPAAANPADWLPSPDAQALRATLWSTLYAVTVLQDAGKRERPSILFWLRLFAALRLALATQDDRQTVAFDTIPIGVPNSLPPRPDPVPEDTPDTTEVDAKARRDRISQIDQTVAALRAAQSELEEIDATLPPTTTDRTVKGPLKDYPGDKNPGQMPPRQAPQGDETQPATPGAFLAPGDLSAGAVQALGDAGIAWEGRIIDTVDDEIDAAVDAAHALRHRLSTRSELTLRGSVLVRRTVPID